MINFDKLTKAIDWSHRQLVTAREKQKDAVVQYVGHHYSSNGSEVPVPVNYIELAMTTYTRAIAARSPRAVVSTDVPELKPYAKDMELALNQVPKELNFSKTLQRAVNNALFSIGIVKVGIAPSGRKELDEEYGQAFADIVTFDDFFVDMSAETIEEIQYIGNDYWMLKDKVKEIYGVDLDADRGLHDEYGDGALETISADSFGEVYGDRVRLRDVYLPGTNEMLTYAVACKKFIKSVPWDGPAGGPYHLLGFSEVPGNLLPLPPVALWMDLHELGNTLYRKLANQADSKKTIGLFSGTDEQSVANFNAASDGEAINYTGAAPTQMPVGGVDQSTLAFFINNKDLFSYFAGNLDALGGLSRMSNTVGQEQMIADAAGARLAHMRDVAIDFIKRIYEDLAWYEWTDEVRKRTIVKRPFPGSYTQITKEWSAETRKGDFLDYNFDIDVYSMQDDSPQIKLEKLGTITERFILPFMDIMLQQGTTLNVQKFISLVCELSNMNDLMDAFDFEEPLEQSREAMGSPSPSFKPATTRREYVRIGQPGMTRQGADASLVQQLMSGKINNAMGAMGTGRT